ncbi:phosphatidylglycerophosphatase A [Candidatus Finniella inopinata]|uniref:Phosphatidylglycerophosphatase A n=1 Tax=Candidatus Finniella inopinata TaxID=1696036 RepID=A0A4Q7DHX1_9PROT|nr:phosphatidylglycerophosphatase A [Candidatus Finniella inopinata]RZI45655.1 phosphatidylglycerophosphatase A [Candidatus Finniella inopinata]
MISTPLFLASFAGVGFFPKAPGTAGTVAGFFVFLFFASLNLPPYALWLGLGVLFVVGWISSHQFLKQSHFIDCDPSCVVIDEVAGIWLTLLLVQLFCPLTWPLYVLCFLAFRFFDIVKPWPIGWLDHRLSQSLSTASFGIMIDDVMAGIMSALVVILGKILST